MKKLTFFFCFVILFSCSCNTGQKDDSGAKKIAEDSSQSPKLNCPTFSGEKNSKAIFGKAIDTCLAVYMMEAYNSFIKSSNVPEKEVTKLVGFSRIELLDWMENSVPEADSFYVAFGIYTPQLVNDYHLDQKYTNRLSVMFWPFRHGVPLRRPSKMKDGDSTLVEAFNLGNLKP